MRILVTGGAGFIGSHIVETFQGKAEIRVLDNLRSGFLKNLDGFNVEFIEGSILDKALLDRAMEGVDYVFHLAAMISVPESMSKPQECVEINTMGTLNVLEAAAKAGARKLCLSTSAAIYGDNPTVPKVETMYPEPKSPYAVTKLDDEYYCAMYTRERNLPLIRQNSVCVYLTRDSDQLPTAGRPLSQSKGLETLRAERLPLYRAWGDVTADGPAPEATAQEILRRLQL